MNQMFSRVPHIACWSGPRENTQGITVSRRDKSPGEAVWTVVSQGFF